ncbi:MAG: hypothetical protein DYG88_03110 [Chloroflexi bacterium CFX4]|nr:hypothetical protein [Chloroflexi bacterium CFX4]
MGDAFGQRFFGDLRRAHRRELPPDPHWRYTDDTNMALSIYAVLALHFAAHFEGERGYGF